MDQEIPPLKLKNLLESNLLTSKLLGRGLAVTFEGHVEVQDKQ